MDVQLAALGKCVVAGDLRLFVDARITPEFFPDDRYRRYYEFMLDHYKAYGVAPGEREVHASFPMLELVDDTQPTQYYIDQLRLRRESVMQMLMMQEASNIAADPDEPDKVVKIRQLLNSHLIAAHLETSGTQDIGFVAGYESVLRRLGERRSNPGYLRGLTTGFRGIDFVTGGLQPEQFVVVTGVPKSGKSSFLLYMALSVHRQGVRPMFIGFEMSNTEQEDRLTSLWSGVSLSKLLNGTTTEAEHKRVWRVQRLIQDMPEFVFSSDISSAMTVQGIQAKIQKYQPAAVFIDGMYMMHSGQDERNFPRGAPQTLTVISRDLKKLAQSARIPIIGTTQSLLAKSKGGLTTGSLGYTSAWGQDADLILGVERQPDTMPPISKFHVLDSRSGPREETYITWDWATGTVQEIEQGAFTPSAKATARKDVWDD